MSDTVLTVVLGAVLLLQFPWFAKAGLLWQIPCRQAMVTAAQLQHRVPCWGYVFEENVLPTTASGSGSSSGGSGSSSGSSARGRRVVLLGDTVDSRPIAPIAVGADLVSHEATFAAGMETKAALAQHSTAWMAGQFAWAIQAKALVLTHFSARYEGSKEKSKWLPQGGYEGRRGRADETDSEERTIKALQREADDQYGLGPVLLAIDLLTAHVPKQEGADAS
jgi:ribonuclease Z